MALDPAPAEKAARKNGGKKPPKNGAAPPAPSGFGPILEVLKSALDRDLGARVDPGQLSGEAAEVGIALNALLTRLIDSERRKATTAQEIDQAVESLLQLVRQ